MKILQKNKQIVFYKEINMSTTAFLRSTGAEFKSIRSSSLELKLDGLQPTAINFADTDDVYRLFAVDSFAAGYAPESQLAALKTRIDKDIGGRNLVFTELDGAKANSNPSGKGFSIIPKNEENGENYLGLMSAPLHLIEAQLKQELKEERKFDARYRVCNSKKDKLTLDDYKQLSDLFIRHTDYATFAPFDTYTPLAMRDRLEDKHSTYYFIRDSHDNSIVGIIGCRNVNDNIHIFDLAVHTDHRHQGLAHKLHEIAAEHVMTDINIPPTEKERSRVFVEADANERKYYEKLGFKSVAEEVEENENKPLACAHGHGVMWYYTPRKNVLTKYHASLGTPSALSPKKNLSSILSSLSKEILYYMLITKLDTPVSSNFGEIPELKNHRNDILNQIPPDFAFTLSHRLRKF
jgi:ribosomal protein S18 acetylase RimI-like enzyme